MSDKIEIRLGTEYGNSEPIMGINYGRIDIDEYFRTEGYETIDVLVADVKIAAEKTCESIEGPSPEKFAYCVTIKRKINELINELKDFEERTNPDGLNYFAILK